MQSADNVKFRDRFGIAFAGHFPNLFHRHRVGVGIVRLLAERAQAATCDADIGRIDMAIDVEVRDVPMQSFAYKVGHVAQRQNIGAAVERDAVFIGQVSGALPLCSRIASELAVFKTRNRHDRGGWLQKVVDVISKVCLRVTRISAAQKAKNRRLT